ncbi:MAG: hypothetical protein JWO79_1166, partial [Actinomycetia bacterium]|nr:hypothetical protein [Actinomycetes bacterium]
MWQAYAVSRCGDTPRGGLGATRVDAWVHHAINTAARGRRWPGSATASALLATAVPALAIWMPPRPSPLPVHWSAMRPLSGGLGEASIGHNADGR